MEKPPPSDLPIKPKLRAAISDRVEHEGRRYLLLRDPTGLVDKSVLVPEALATLLSLCDGSREISELQSGMMLRTGVPLTPSMIRDLLVRLDEAMLLENGAFGPAYEEALRAYRDAPHRPPSHAGLVYPNDPEDLSRTIQKYLDTSEASPGGGRPSGDLVGMVCPHIDYERGHATYADLWRRAEPSLAELELVIIFGTDHSGGPGQITLTRQSYKTPLGVLPTDIEIVEQLAEALGPDDAFSEEIHHAKEHSIELASVWLHYFIGGRPCPIVPILCGSFHQFVSGNGNVLDSEAIGGMLDVLINTASSRRTLFVAAGDLAHVGPAFGDPRPEDSASRARLKVRDRESMDAVCAGDAEGFFDLSRTESGARKVCGLPPIYMMLKCLPGARGEWMGYDQCIADAAGGSFVSIAGALLYNHR